MKAIEKRLVIAGQTIEEIAELCRCMKTEKEKAKEI